MYVQYYAVNAVNTSTESANATLDGKAKNVLFVMMNAKSLIAMATDIASTESVHASEVIKANFAEKLTVHTQPVQGTAFVLKDLVSARRDGREQTVRPWTKMLFSVCQIAQVMERLMLILRLALVTLNGLVMTALKVRFILNY